MSLKSLAAFRCLALVAAATLVASVRPVAAADKAAGPDPAKFSKIVDQGIQYLRTKGQVEDGSYGRRSGPGITALITTGVIRNGRSTKDPLVAKSLDYIVKFVQPSGGIHHPQSRFSTYETCLAMMCLTEANENGKYDKILAGAEKYIRGLQWDGEEGHDQSSPAYGGAGYGNDTRPDLSNTQYFIEALRSVGADENDEAIKKALIFVSRCQNLESEHNTTEFGAKVNDGGFYYTPADGGSSQLGKTDNGGLRSYASMTYAGLKSMIFAGVDADDPRVKAAYDFARKNYDVHSNPGLGQAGVFYYYQTFAKALNAMGVDQVVGPEGKSHDWRAELVNELATRQQADGSWVNTDPKWMEGDPNLVTGFALLTLSYCKPNSAAAEKTSE